MDRTIRDVLVVAAIGAAAYLVAPALVHENVNPIVGGICSLATPDAWHRMLCELGAVAPQQTTYTFGPGVKCSWLAPDRYYPVNPPLKVGTDGSYALKLTDGFLLVPASGNATLSDQQGGPVRATGQCQKVGGL
jgi:hypothetical protein